MFFIPKRVYDVYMEFMNAKTCILTIASKISWLYSEVIMSYETDEIDISVNGNKLNLCFKVILRSRI